MRRAAFGGWVLSLLLAVACGADGSLKSPPKPDGGASDVGSTRCTTESGTFTNTLVAGPGCLPQSAVLLCTHGQLMGGLQGTYDYFADSVFPAPTLAEPDRLRMTARSHITLDGGELSSEDVTYLTPSLLGPSQFRDVIDFVSGTGPYQGATGALNVTGTVDLISGQGSGTYSGQLCLPANGPSGLISRSG